MTQRNSIFPVILAEKRLFSRDERDDGKERIALASDRDQQSLNWALRFSTKAAMPSF